MKKRHSLTAAAMAFGLVAGSAQAQPVQLQPASLLIFPFYVSADGTGTVINVTNQEDSRVYCGNSDFREGDVVLHYVYIDGTTWREFDRYEPLTPGDTLSVIAADHNPDSDRGFLVVKALDPQSLEAMQFDNLIGSAIVVESNLNFMWQYEPYGFRAGNTLVPIVGSCPGRLGTDFDLDGLADFNGGEYDFFPDQLFIDSFFEERGQFGNELVLLSTAGQDYINEIDFVFWNNNEEKFSRNNKFVCWEELPLSAISRIVTNLGGTSAELATGWASIRGHRILDLSGNPVGADRPAILGVFMQMIRSSQFSDGHALHFTGAQNGGEL